MMETAGIDHILELIAHKGSSAQFRLFQEKVSGLWVAMVAQYNHSTTSFDPTYVIRRSSAVEAMSVLNKDLGEIAADLRFPNVGG